MSAPGEPSRLDHRPRLRARRVRFDWQATPLHWVPGDPITTHALNMLHLLLPAGERWFCDVYRQALPLVTDDGLRADLKGFIGQEAMHARAHATAAAPLPEAGIDTAPFTRRVDWLFDRVLGDHPLGTPRWWRLVERRWLVARLAMIAAMEHFFSVLGRWIVEHSTALDEAGADPTMLDLLRWHGAEEVEHRAVAFDVYEHVSGSYPRRVAAVAVVLPGGLLYALWATLFLIRRDPTTRIGIPRTFAGLLRSARAGRIPRLGLLLRSVPAYLRRDHHPSRTGGDAAALAYLASSPAAAAAS